jgi:hypothetical protein
LDLVSLGNLLEFGELLDRRFYLGHLSSQDAEEHRISRFNYHLFQKWFLKEYVLVANGKSISPSAVFDRALCQFSAALILYKARTKEVPRAEECSPKKFRKLVEEFFANVHPELVVTLKRLVETEEESLHWMGPDFSVRQRLEADEENESAHFDDWKLSDDSDSHSSSEEEFIPAAPRGRKRVGSISDGESFILVV